MALVTITKGGITTSVPRGELDWYKRNGWAVPSEAQPDPTPEPEAPAPVEETEPEAPAKKKSGK